MLLLTAVVVLFQLHLLSAENSSSTSDSAYESNSDEENYDDVGSGFVDISNSTDHFKNCTIDNIVYYDEQCDGWMRQFYVFLTVGSIGLIFLFIMIYYCAKKICCSRGTSDRELLIDNDHNWSKSPMKFVATDKY